MTGESTADLAERLGRLERAHRRLKGAVAAVLLGVAAVALMGQAAAVPETVTARKFVLKDWRDRTLAELDADLDGRPSLVMSESDGKPRLRVGFDQWGSPGLQVLDSSGTIRIAAAVGAAGRPFVRLFDAGQVPLFAMDALDASHVFRLYHGRTARVEIGVGTKGTPGLLMYDAHGTVRARLIVEDDGRARLETPGGGERR